MSTSPTFKYRGPDKRCPFPFDRDSAGSVSPYYVTLTDSGGDEGLAEACRLWWLIEDLSMTPVGSFVDSVSVTHSFPGTPYFDTITMEPVDRAGYIGSRFFDYYDSASVGGIMTNEEQFSFHIGYDSGEWRMYYTFNFFIQPTSLNGAIVITNGTGPSGTADHYATGTFSLFGYTLNWLAEADGISMSGAGLSASSTFYTLI